jgi:hypothetical protein
LWRRYPGPLVGVRTGEASGLSVLDIDGPKHPEADVWLAAHRAQLPATRIHRTRSGGLHFGFQHVRACTTARAASAARPKVSIRVASGWPEGEADGAAAACFRAWLDRRGTKGDQEVEAGIRQVRGFIEVYGDSRFVAAWEQDPERVVNRAGFRKQTKAGWEYYVLPEQWRAELARGYDSSALAFAMIARGLMVGDGDKSSVPLTVRGQRIRVYRLLPTILE